MITLLIVSLLYYGGDNDYLRVAKKVVGQKGPELEIS